MADIGYRRKGENGPMYNPERDYAYITPTLMRVAIERLETSNTIDTKWREENGITSEEIGVAVTALAHAQRDFINAADPVYSFEQALSRHHFFDCRYIVRQYIFATLGEVFCAAWFAAVREVSLVGEESPAQTDMARFCASVREFVNRTKGTTYDANFLAEHLRMQQDVLNSRIKQLLGELAKCREELRQATAVKKEKKQSAFSQFCSLFRKTK